MFLIDTDNDFTCQVLPSVWRKQLLDPLHFGLWEEVENVMERLYIFPPPHQLVRSWMLTTGNEDHLALMVSVSLLSVLNVEMTAI